MKTHKPKCLQGSGGICKKVKWAGWRTKELNSLARSSLLNEFTHIFSSLGTKAMEAVSVHLTLSLGSSVYWICNLGDVISSSTKRGVEITSQVSSCFLRLKFVDAITSVLHLIGV